MLLFMPFVLLLSTLLYGCSAGEPMVGGRYGDPPPRMKRDSQHPGIITWHNATAFGPVPANLVAEAQAICTRMDRDNVHYLAIGYHPRAQDINGKPFSDGGFYCLPE